MPARPALTHPTEVATPDGLLLAPGTPVEVRSRFVARWARGFEVAEVLDEPVGRRYRLRRSSDRTVLPALFGPPEVRPDPRYAAGPWPRPAGTAG